jgi:hypothetical protein
MQFIRLRYYCFIHADGAEKHSYFLNNNCIGGNGMPTPEFVLLINKLKEKTINEVERQYNLFVHPNRGCWAFFKTEDELKELITSLNYKVIIEGIDIGLSRSHSQAKIDNPIQKECFNRRPL